jgi:hypothetical protein
MKHWGWMTILLLGFAAVAGAAAVEPVDRPNTGELNTKPLAANEPVDFTSLRKQADAMAARQHSSFKLHQVEIEFGFPSDTLRINQVNFHYFRPVSRAFAGSQSQWEELKVYVDNNPWWPKNRGIMGEKGGPLNDPRPSSAPANILAPEDALRRLNRGPMSSPASRAAGFEPHSEWRTLNVQLIQIGAKYWAGVPTSPGVPNPRTGESGFYTEEPFFVKTALPGKWVWWTVTQHDVPGTRYEYIYIDAVTGKATSHCAEAPSYSGPLVPVPCAPPR